MGGTVRRAQQAALHHIASHHLNPYTAMTAVQ